MGSHPLHGAWCSSWTYPWSCPTCGAAVFVYECTCGSWVMFDELGGDWPQHSCFETEYKRLREKVLPILKAGADPASATFRPFAELRERLGPSGASRPPAEDIAKTGEDGGGARPVPEKPSERIIKRMDPMPEETISIVGVIRERHTGTARIRALYAELGALGRKLMGLPAESHAVQLTIVDTQGEPHESYSGIADKTRIEGGLTEGVMVWVRMTGKVYPSASAWVINDIHAI